MIVQTYNASIERLLLRLPIRLRKKFAFPRHPELVHTHYGQTEMQILHRAVFEIGYAADYDLDGNWDEFTTWTGFTDADMCRIRKEMIKLGWQPGHSVF